MFHGSAWRGNKAAISPIALEAVKRIDALFDIERGINGQSAEGRLREQRSRLTNSSSVAERLTICCSAGISLPDSSTMGGST